MSTPEAANYARDIRTDLNAQRLLDGFDSSNGFDAPIAEVVNSYGESLAEMDRSPSAIHGAFEDMDADEQLLRMAIRQRQGFRRAYAAARDSLNTPGQPNVPVPGGAVPGAPGAAAPYPNPGGPPGAPPFPGWIAPPVVPFRRAAPLAQLRQLGQVAGWGLERAPHVLRNLSREGFGLYGTYDVVKENWAAKVAMSAGTGLLLRSGLQALGVAGGPLGEMVGMANGAIWGYVRGKNQTESAAQWMHELGITKMNADQINLLDEDRLERTLGIIKNAVDDGRVRGGPEQKLEMAAKFRLMRNRLIALRNEANTRGDPLNPILKGVDDALSSELEVASNLSRVVGRKYETEFGEIMDLKKHKVLMNTIKGGVVGGTVGGIFGFIMEHGGPHGAIDWIHDKIQGINHDITGANPELTDHLQEALEAKKQLIEQSANIQNEVIQNQANLDQLQNIHNVDASGMGHVDLSPDQMTALNHYEQIQNLSQAGQDASVEGFKNSLTTDLGTFNGFLYNGNLHEMIDMANVHNLDINTVLPNGEHFSQFLMENKDTFLQFPPEIQSFILSHPSTATEFMDIATAGTENTLKAIVDRYSIVLGAAAIGGGIALFTHAHRGQKEADKGIKNANTEGFQKVKREMVEGGGINPTDRQRTAAETARTTAAERTTRIEANRQVAINTLTGAESVVFNGGPRNADLRGIVLHVDRVNTDAAGRASTMVLNPVNPPIPQRRDINNVDVNDYIDNDGNLRMNMITLRSQETIQREYERFLNQPILGRFRGGTFIPDPTRVVALNLPQNMARGIQLEGHAVWPIGLDLNLRLTNLRTPVVQNPVYSAEAEHQLGTAGNYVYREGFRTPRDAAKINQIRQVLDAGSVGAGMSQLIYMGRNFFSVESVANNNTDVVLQRYDNTGVPTGPTINTTRAILENSELYIFDQA